MHSTARRAQRQERQARVGILRNPNRPPQPPARKAALMGKWPRLRSSRRPANMPETDFDTPADAQVQLQGSAQGQVPLVEQTDDQITGINIAGLMDSVRDIGRDQGNETAVRRSFAADLREAEADLGPLTARSDAAAERPSRDATAHDPYYDALEDDFAPARRSPLRLVLAAVAALALIGTFLVLMR